MPKDRFFYYISAMGRVQHLTFEEKIKIEAYHDAGLSTREIGLKFHRSHPVVVRFLKNAASGSRKDNRGKKSKLTAKDKRRIVREAINHKRSSVQIRVDLQLPVSTKRVRQILSSNVNLKWRKMLRKPKLTERHKQNRLNFAEEYIAWTHEWKNVIFSDEKKFNLDGPDGWQCYWHDLRKDPDVKMSRSLVEVH